MADSNAGDESVLAYWHGDLTRRMFLPLIFLSAGAEGLDGQKR
jgi:hypothetical protein